MVLFGTGWSFMVVKSSLAKMLAEIRQQDLVGVREVYRLLRTTTYHSGNQRQQNQQYN
jgi:hypothetical protein